MLLALAALIHWLVSTNIFSNDIENPIEETDKLGSIIATYKKVPAYQNGEQVTRSHGRHYSEAVSYTHLTLPTKIV